MSQSRSDEFAGQHILSANQLSKEGHDRLFALSRRMKPIATQKVSNHVMGKYKLGSFFFEESTRTRLSSEAAFLNLGGKILTFTNMEFSSMTKKGESFEDTITVMSQYCQVMVCRFKRKGDAAKAAKYARCPLINAGDGEGEHPTQSLLDLFTAVEEVGNLEGKTIAMVGDLRKGRTVHSFVRSLIKYCKFLNLVLVAPAESSIPEDLRNEIQASKFRLVETDDFIGGIKQADVVYMVRPQSERMTPEENERIAGRYKLTRSLLEEHCPNQPLILHPLPRNAEIATDVDDLPGAAYLEKQILNGILVRMALFILVLDKEYKFP